MADKAPTIDALGQFTLHPALGPVGASVGFTNANLMMVFAVAITSAFLIVGMRPRAVIPGRLQAAAEMTYDFVLSICLDQIGPEGRRYFPFVFTLFSFVLFGNLLGLLPYQFTYTSHIAVTGALAVFVFLLATVVGIVRHGWHFFSLFYPKGTPIYLAPLIVLIEVVTYLSRPLSLSVRLFANMLAGHVVFEVFATFVILMAGAGFIGVAGSIIPLVFNVAMMGFELLVAALQAYIFALLTCIYLHDAEHLH